MLKYLKLCYAYESTQGMQHWYFSFIILLPLRRPIEPKFSQVCYCMYVGIHQVRRLVFYNYQRVHPVPFLRYIYFFKDVFRLNTYKIFFMHLWLFQPTVYKRSLMPFHSMILVKLNYQWPISQRAKDRS